MGLGSALKSVGSSVMGGFGLLDKPFRTGATSAAREAQYASKEQAKQFQKFFDLIKPSIQTGTQGLEEFSDYSSFGGLNDLYQQAQDSPLAESMIADRERAADAYFASTGMRRSGGAGKAAAQIPTDVFAGLMDKILGMKQNVATIGLGQGGTALGALNGSNTATGAASQFGMIPSQNKQNLFGGLLSAGGQMGGSALMASALASDARLKTNIRKIGKIGPLNVHEWEWKDPSFNGVMKAGFIAQEVYKVYPHHVHVIEVNGEDLLGVDYEGVLREAA